MASKPRLREVLLIVSPLVAIMAFVAGLLGVIMLPTLLRDRFPPETFGAAGSYLRLAYWSNFGIMFYCGFGMALSILLAGVWIILAARRWNRGRFGSIVHLFGLAGLMLAFPLGISYLMITSEKIVDTVARHKADLNLLEKGETELYEGPLTLGRGLRPVPGPHYEGRPAGARPLVTAGPGERLHCPLPIADALRLETGKTYRVRYLPHTLTVVSVEERVGANAS